MTDSLTSSPKLLTGWRIAGWGALLAIFMIPVIIAPLTNEMNWGPEDYIFAAVMLSVVGVGFEIAVHVSRGGAHMIGLGIAIVTGFLTIWSNLAVGILGSEDALVNLGFFAAVLGGLVASFAVWFRPKPMIWVMALLALAQYGMGLTAKVTMPGHGVEWGVLCFFAALWTIAALCFRQAASATTPVA